MVTTSKNQEQMLRRKLNKSGFSLCKSRHPFSVDNFGGYMITESNINAVVVGNRFDLSLDDVNDWVMENCTE